MNTMMVFLLYQISSSFLNTPYLLTIPLLLPRLTLTPTTLGATERFHILNVQSGLKERNGFSTRKEIFDTPLYSDLVQSKIETQVREYSFARPLARLPAPLTYLFALDCSPCSRDLRQWVVWLVCSLTRCRAHGMVWDMTSNLNSVLDEHVWGNSKEKNIVLWWIGIEISHAVCS